MQRIVIVDDSPALRMSAMIEVRSLQNVLIPETPDELLSIDIHTIGLLILDKHVSDEWQIAIRSVLRVLPERVTIAEWSIDDTTPIRDAADFAITKRIGRLREAITKWQAERRRA